MKSSLFKIYAGMLQSLEYCFCEGLPDKTVVFLTVGPHGKAYAVK